MSKDELKAKIGNMKITKNELNQKWEDYEQDRKDKIAKILEVSYPSNFAGKEESGG